MSNLDIAFLSPTSFQSRYSVLNAERDAVSSRWMEQMTFAKKTGRFFSKAVSAALIIVAMAIMAMPAALADYTVPATGTQDASYTILIDSGDGNRIKARNGATDNIEFDGSDPAAVLQSAIDALASTGGRILLTSGTYVWQSVPALPKDLPNWLEIVGDGEVIIQLTENGPRAFDFGKTADYDTFRNIRIENLVIDCNGVGGRNHVVLGTLRNDDVQTRINIENITVGNITTRNVPVDPTSKIRRLNIWITVKHLAAGEKQTRITNILVENCNFMGGNSGVVIGGQGANVTGLNIFIDRILIRNCRHSLLLPQTELFHSANFYVGFRGFGGYAHIVDCYGEYSGDVGVEIDALNALVENTTIKDATNVAFFQTNYNNPEDGKDQTVVFRNCVALKADLSSNLAGRGFVTKSSLSVGLGTVILSSCAFRSSIPSTASGDWVRVGEAVRITSSNGMTALTIDGFDLTMDGIDYSVANVSRINPIYLDVVGGVPLVTIKNTYMIVHISRHANAGPISFTGIDLGGNMILDLDNVKLDYAMTNASNSTSIGIDVGNYGSALSGTISRFNAIQMTEDSGSYGIMVRRKATLTITDRLSIHDCNFSATTAGKGVSFTGPDQNIDKVLLENNTLRIRIIMTKTS